jgi:hypothetical protein
MLYIYFCFVARRVIFLRNTHIHMHTLTNINAHRHICISYLYDRAIEHLLKLGQRVEF